MGLIIWMKVNESTFPFHSLNIHRWCEYVHVVPSEIILNRSGQLRVYAVAVSNS